METLQHSYGTIQLGTRTRKSSLMHRFFAWCDGQEKNRLGWVALIIVAHGCVITPATLFFVIFAGNNFVFWPFVIAAMGMCLVTNLAALPTRLTLPIFLVSLCIDLAVIANCVAIALQV